MATAKSPTKFRSWSSTDSEDPGDIHRLYDPELSTKSSSRKCMSTWTFSLVILSSCVLFLLGLLIGYYVHERQSLDAPVDSDCHYRGRSDGFSAAQISEAHENIMYFMSAFNIQSMYSQLSSSGDQSSGSRWDIESVEHIRSEFVRYGMDSVEVEEYEVAVTYPDPSNPNRLELINAASQVKMNVTFDQMPMSRTTLLSAVNETKPPFLSNENGRNVYPYVALSPAGIIEGTLVYGHYGRHVDMLMLNRSRIVLTDTVLLLRLGKLSVVEKIKVAADWGAIGVLLYVDPADLTYQVKDEVKVIPYAAAGEHKGSSPSLALLPAQTVSMEMATLLMRSFDEKQVPQAWRGGLNTTYRYGQTKSGQQRVKLVVNNKQKTSKVRHVVGTLQGDMETDRFVMIGSSRTSFPSDFHGNVGTAHLLELANSLSQVRKLEKWGSRRGVKLISWGGNEFSGIGQSEFLKVNKHILKMKAVAYIDLDLTVHQGHKSNDPKLIVTTNKLLSDLVQDVVTQVPDPAYPETRIADSWSGVQQYRKLIDASCYLHGNRNHLFRIQEMGIPVVQSGYILPMSMKTEDSLQDSRHHFRYHLAAARVISLVLLSLLDNKILMYNVQGYTRSINEAVKKSTQILHQNGKYDIDKLLMRADTLERTGQAFQEYLMTMGSTEVALDTRDINDVMMLLEKTFVTPVDFRSYASMIYEITDNGQLSLLQDVVSWIKAGDKWTDLECVVDLLTTALDQCNAALQLS